MKKLILTLLLTTLFGNCKNADNYTYLHKCLNNKITKTKTLYNKNDFYKLSNIVENNLLDSNLLKETNKNGYIELIVNINKSKKIKEIRKIIEKDISIEEKSYLSSFKLDQNILICMRKYYFITKDKKIEIENFFKIINNIQLFKDKENKLLLHLMDNFDDNFYKNKYNRSLIIHYIFYIYSSQNNFNENEVYY